MTRAPAASVVILLLIGCSAGNDAKTATPSWSFTEVPSFDVGVAQGEEPYELDGAASSLRLGDGRVLIANTGSSEIRVFDSLGRFQSSIGRKGAGPGEFSGAIQLVAVSSGGFAAYDRGEDRLSWFDAAGQFVNAQRVEAQGSTNPFPLWVWLYRANWIVGPLDSTGRSSIAASLLRMGDPPAGGYRFVHVAGDGRIWSQIRMTGDSVEPWQVHSPDGGLVAVADLPKRFEIHQIGPDFVLGRHWDANDVEHIQRYGIEPSPTAATVATAVQTVRDTSGYSTLSAGLKVSLRNLVMAQEMFYADSNRYATRNGSLDWNAESGAILHLMEADRRGWVGLAVQNQAPVICGMAVGNSTPPGWPEGAPRCGTP